MSRARELFGACLSTAALCACLEPNPYAEDAGETTADTNTSNDTNTDNDTTTEDGGPICDPCGLQFEVVEFDAGNDGYSGSVPKPDLPHTVPIAIVTDYRPGNSDNLGYAISWTDAGTAWDIEVTVTNAANNSGVSGRAIVLGLSDEVGEPEVVETTVNAADMCGAATIDPLDGRIIVDAVERYEPVSNVVFSYARTSGPSGDGVAVDYCITGSDMVEGSLTHKLVAFDVPPEGVTAIEIPEVAVTSQAPQSEDYPELPAGAEVLHLIGTREYDDASAEDLGYGISCSGTSPYACSFDLSGFKAGARVVAGGVIVAVQ